MNSFKKDYNILVIEDNDGDYMLVESYLLEQEDEPNVSRAGNFAEASKLLSDSGARYDVVLLDLTLPDKGGVPLIRDILELCPATPVIVLTGFSDFSYGARSLTLGVSDYILKSELSATSLFKSIVYSAERKIAVLAFEDSERRYGEVFRLCPAPILIIDPATQKFLDVNTAAINLYGYTQKEFLSMGMDDIRAAERLEQEHIAGGQNKMAGQGLVLHRNQSGNTFKVDIKSNSIRYKGHNALIILTVPVDPQ